MTIDQIPTINPSTGEQTGSIPVMQLDSIPDRIDATRKAQQNWSEYDLRARKDAVKQLQQGFLAHAETIAQILKEECGRPAGEAWTAEIVANHELFTWWLKHIDDLLTATPVDLNPINYPGKEGRVRLDPKGLIGLITPWNLPVAIPLRTIIPAVLAGNAVVWKPSEHTPRVSAALSTLFDEFLGPDLVQLIQGTGAHGAAVVESGVDVVFFTGSVKTGRRVQVESAKRGTPCALELGGKDAAIVLEDANLERAAHGITWAAFGFAGQNCAAVERCFVHASVFEEFVEKVKTCTAGLKRDRDIGPLVTQDQLTVVQRQLEDALSRGASIVEGGPDGGPGYYHPPTVLLDVPADALMMTEETFGPLLPITPFQNVEELADLVNGTPFGLTTSVWTQNVAFGEALAEQFDCGVITINNHSFLIILI